MIKYILNIGRIGKQVLSVLWNQRDTMLMAFDMAEKATSSVEKKEKIKAAKASFEQIVNLLEELGVGNRG
jgi:hypothetical protein